MFDGTASARLAVRRGMDRGKGERGRIFVAWRSHHTAFGDRKSFLPMVPHAAGGSSDNAAGVLSCALLGAMRA